MDDALEDDRICDRRYRLEEIARDKFDAVADADLLQMPASGLRASRKVKHGSAQLPVLLRDGAEQLARSAANVHQMRYPAEIVGAEDIRCHKPRKLHHRHIELVDDIRRSTHQIETVGKALQF